MVSVAGGIFCATEIAYQTSSVAAQVAEQNSVSGLGWMLFESIKPFEKDTAYSNT
jgi:hypothetical protein